MDIKKLIFILMFSVLTAISANAQAAVGKPADAAVSGTGASALISWRNPDDAGYAETVVFRSTIPIEPYFTYQAVEGLCDLVYRGNAESYADSGLAQNLPYYYILFARDKNGISSGAVVLEKRPVSEKPGQTEEKKNLDSLAGANSAVVNEVSLNEAGIIYNYNKPVEMPEDSDARRLSLFIIVRSPHSLNENDKNAISYFIHTGSPTTIFLGTGERAGVLNSYLSVFDKLPRNQLEWQDVIKIANGRWPNQRNIEAEETAADTYFSIVYSRQPDMDNPNDNAAVTVIAYGLRPAQRNLESEKKAIEIYRSIFDRSPVEASDWDLVRAIAYSGATR